MIPLHLQYGTHGLIAAGPALATGMTVLLSFTRRVSHRSIVIEVAIASIQAAIVHLSREPSVPVERRHWRLHVCIPDSRSVCVILAWQTDKVCLHTAVHQVGSLIRSDVGRNLVNKICIRRPSLNATCTTGTSQSKEVGAFGAWAPFPDIFQVIQQLLHFGLYPLRVNRIMCCHCG